ncbi:unnamed protein product [Peronospora destructor]|uniref:V-SNARE coiled-coil homology domain-containing protein n=1 Tax=Peronospora destructor TaxID=86335 RepID=A0AAV0VCQ6_9STRA|nr:unnamed protein product [Peronospora destructor]
MKFEYVLKQNGLNKDCIEPFTAIATAYDDHAKVDKLSEVMNQQHPTCVVQYRKKIRLVKQKINDLNEQVKVFCNTSRKLRRQMWWKNVKLAILLNVFAQFSSPSLSFQC